MAYGINTVRDGLRKAGTAINDFDKAYAGKIEENVRSSMDNTGGLNDTLQGFRGTTSAVPLQDAFFAPDDPSLNSIQNVAANAAVGTANVASRYLLPAGGVTLAGAALYDLTNQFGGAADRPEPGQLGMGN